MQTNLKNPKVAVILFNLGGPNEKTNVKQFLFNLFYDRAILNFPNPFRWILAKFISIVRVKKSQLNYDLIGGISPIVANTLEQASLLEQKLNLNPDINVKVFVCMRYAYPRVYDIMDELKNFLPDEIILLPLYPQFSTTTTLSSIEEFKRNITHQLNIIPLKSICCFYSDSNFIDSLVERIDNSIKNISDKSKSVIIFSAHGLPQKIIDEGDPYQWQVEQTVAKVIDKLKIKFSEISEYIISYQSRVGPVSWIKPYTDKVIAEAAKQSKSIVIVPIAFVSEHLETLVELDIEYKDIALKMGAKEYIRVPTQSNSELFIDCLAKIIVNIHQRQSSDIVACNFNRQCPGKYIKCPIKE